MHPMFGIVNTIACLFSIYIKRHIIQASKLTCHLFPTGQSGKHTYPPTPTPTNPPEAGFQDDTLKQAQQHASNNAGPSGSSDLFSNIMSAVGNKQEKIQNEDIDEEGATAPSHTTTPS